MSATQPVTVPSRGRRVVARALGLAELGHAQWFFGNCYEAIVRVPDLLAEHARASEQAMSPIGSGSPVRYYIAAAPGTLPAIVVATIAGRRDRNGRPWLVTAAMCSIAGAGVTAYLVRTVNRELPMTSRVGTLRSSKPALVC